MISFLLFCAELLLLLCFDASLSCRSIPVLYQSNACLSRESAAHDGTRYHDLTEKCFSRSDAQFPVYIRDHHQHTQPVTMKHRHPLGLFSAYCFHLLDFVMSLFFSGIVCDSVPDYATAFIHVLMIPCKGIPRCI